MLVIACDASGYKGSGLDAVEYHEKVLEGTEIPPRNRRAKSMLLSMPLGYALVMKARRLVAVSLGSSDMSRREVSTASFPLPID